MKLFLVFVFMLMSFPLSAETFELSSSTESGVLVDFKLVENLVPAKNGSYCSSYVSANVFIGDSIVSCKSFSKKKDLSGFWSALFNLDSCFVKDSEEAISRIKSEVLRCENNRYVLFLSKFGFLNEEGQLVIEDIYF
jgi:hypothetical protein